MADIKAIVLDNRFQYVLENRVDNYKYDILKYISEMREKFGDIPVIQIQLGRIVSKNNSLLLENVLKLREMQRLLPLEVENCHVISTINEELSDFISLCEKSEKHIKAQIEDITRNKQKCIEIEKISFSPCDIENRIDISVKLENLNGQLKSNGRPTGFHLTHNKYQPEYDIVFDTWFEKDTIKLRAELNESDMSGMYIYYGLGLNPYCNITDELGRNIPAFGPVKLA